MKNTILLIAIILLIAGCARYARPVRLINGADSVKFYRNSDPPVSCKEIRPIEIRHGKGCGSLGNKGNFEGAYNMFRNKVISIGGDTAIIQRDIPPHQEYGCYVLEYYISGIAFKCE